MPSGRVNANQKYDGDTLHREPGAPSDSRNHTSELQQDATCELSQKKTVWVWPVDQTIDGGVKTGSSLESLDHVLSILSLW